MIALSLVYVPLVALAEWHDTSRDDHNLMQRVYLPTAKCLDGSPAAAYIAQNESSNQWIFWLEGGGICTSDDDCAGRAQGDLGSSKNYAPTIYPGRGMLEYNFTTNPDFSTWNRVFVPYCSGDVWAGTSSIQVNPWNEGTFEGYFQGHTIVEAVLNASRDQAHLSNATDVILTGCSAGGIGTFLNCDFTADYLAKLNPATKTRCRPEAGYFGLPISDWQHWSTGEADPDMRKIWRSNWTLNVGSWVLQSEEGKACVAAVNSGKLKVPHCDGQPGGAAVCCGVPPVLYPFIQTPLFVSENTADSYQVYSGNGCPHTYSQKVVEYILYLKDVLAGSLVDVIKLGAKNKTDGMFAPACLRHCFEWIENTADIDGRTHAQAFGDWYFGRTPGNDMSINLTDDPKAFLSCSDQVKSAL